MLEDTKENSLICLYPQLRVPSYIQYYLQELQCVFLDVYVTSMNYNSE